MSLKQILIAICFTFIVISVTAQVPNTISYQGRLLDTSGNPVIDNTYLVKFTIYDAPIGGAELWTSNFQTVNTISGLFSYELGSITTLTAGIFDDTSRYLGITIGTDPELSPRTKLNSTPYSLAIDDAKYVNVTGDTMSGVLEMQYDGNTRGRFYGLSSAGLLQLYGSDNLLQAFIGASSWGALGLSDNSGDLTVELSASNNLGAYLNLIDPIGSEDIVLNAGGTGNSTLLLPDNAIDNREILDEPGIASNLGSTDILLTDNMQDLVTTTITIPADGYIHITGTCISGSSGSTITTYGIFQIDETAGGALISPYYSIAGPQTALNTAFNMVSSVFTERTYYKTAGTYSFRFEGMRGSTSATVFTDNHKITAVYYPTSYGTVATSSLQPPSDVDAELVTSTNLDGSTSTGYKYDLRDLELKAKEAQLRLKEAELEALKLEQELNRAKAEQGKY